MAKTKKQEPTEEEQEQAAVELMANAYEIAEQLFKDKSNQFAVETIYDYHTVADSEVFAEDLHRIYEKSKTVYKTETPSPEQVFGLFERVFDEDEEE